MKKYMRWLQRDSDSISRNQLAFILGAEGGL